MRYAIGLSLIGTGALLIYSGFAGESAWGLISSAITGQEYESKRPKSHVGYMDKSTGQTTSTSPYV